MCVSLKKELGLPVSEEYARNFFVLENGKKLILKDECSEANSSLPIIALTRLFYAKSDNSEFITDSTGQKKADYIIFCHADIIQVGFIELKGSNISGEPFQQIVCTIDFLKKTEGLKELVSSKVEKHAFIVSPFRQKIPKGLYSYERTLLKKLGTKQNVEQNAKFLHYVTVIHGKKYSDKQQRIIYSSDYPLEFPYKENKER